MPLTPPSKLRQFHPFSLLPSHHSSACQSSSQLTPSSPFPITPHPTSPPHVPQPPGGENAKWKSWLFEANDAMKQRPFRHMQKGWGGFPLPPRGLGVSSPPRGSSIHKPGSERGGGSPPLNPPSPSLMSWVDDREKERYIASARRLISSLKTNL